MRAMGKQVQIPDAGPLGTAPSEPSGVCQTCRLRATCLIAVPLPEERGRCAPAARRRQRLAPGQRLFRRGAAFGTLYQVCSGTVKTQRETPEGMLVITGFFFPGDVVGVDSIGQSNFQSDAVAIGDSEICQFNFDRLLTQCTQVDGLQEWIVARVAHYAQRKDHDLSWSMGLQTDRRILRFFVDLHERLRAVDRTAHESVALPMKKQDIARYLHITPETLSRHLSQLRRDGLLVVQGERFHVPDLGRAHAMTRL